MMVMAEVPAVDWLAVARLRQALASGEARRLREAAGLSLAEVARRLGTGPSVIWRWEVGERVPRDTALAIRYWHLLERLRRQERRAGR